MPEIAGHLLPAARLPATALANGFIDDFGLDFQAHKDGPGLIENRFHMPGEFLDVIKGIGGRVP